MKNTIWKFILQHVLLVRKLVFRLLTSLANHFVVGTMTGAGFYLGFFVLGGGRGGE